MRDMDGLDFPKRYGAQRLAAYAPQPPLLGAPAPADGGEADPEQQVILDYEVDPQSWTAIPVTAPPGWRPADWPERPVRFVDGKDVGETVTWLRAPYGGYPVPVRLAEIGGVAVRDVEGEVRREFAAVERVVSMVVDPFPWQEVEAFAAALQEHGFRLLPATPPGEGRACSYDFEEMRQATQNRSIVEMGVLEKAALACGDRVPTVVDGRLERLQLRRGGFEQQVAPVVGVVKTQREFYLHPRGMQVLYDLQAGQRTPLFVIGRLSKRLVPAAPGERRQTVRLPVVSWFLRLDGTPGSMPNWGVVRVEVPLAWFERRGQCPDLCFVDRLSRTLCHYRCRDATYGRQAVSLHPIVRAEALLGALFSPGGPLASHFWRLLGL